MTVTSLGTDSFQGTVWGVTYTVNWSGSSPEFYLRYGNNANSAVSQEISVGDQVGVQGMVTQPLPLTVNAEVVRDYSLLKPHAMQPNSVNVQQTGPNGQIGSQPAQGTGAVVNGSTSATVNGTPNGISTFTVPATPHTTGGGNSAVTQSQINALLKELQSLQSQLGSTSNTGASGNASDLQQQMNSLLQQINNLQSAAGSGGNTTQSAQPTGGQPVTQTQPAPQNPPTLQLIQPQQSTVPAQGH